MSKNDILGALEAIIKDTFIRVQKSYDEPKSSKLIFPKYRDNRGNIVRVSEQELRFAFVESFLKYDDEHCLNWHYAVEVPTNDRYLFGEKVPRISSDGRSARFDLVIYSGAEQHSPLCLIEFKANNPDTFAYRKDFLKLLNPEEGGSDVLRYFIQIVENSDKVTEKNIVDKYEDAQKYAHKELKDMANIEVVTKTYSLVNKEIICIS